MIDAQAGADVSCARCDAACCRLTVLVAFDDAVPAHLTEWNEHGMQVMARDEDGWCVAVDSGRMNCSIYDSRPQTCRDFRRGGRGCSDVRAEYAGQRFTLFLRSGDAHEGD